MGKPVVTKIKNSDLVGNLIEALRCLPGVGPKSAARMAFDLLQYKREQGKVLSERLAEAMTQVGHCARCNTFTEASLCQLCLNSKRSTEVLCVVAMPGDILTIEQTTVFDGHYFVLMGLLSPLDGIGPKELKLEKLYSLVEEFNTKEVILAFSPTTEGEATAHFISEHFKENVAVKLTRLASGIPAGSELEYMDPHTIGHAMLARKAFV